MRLLLVGAGAAFSTKDVENGYRRALGSLLGDDLYFYDLGSRLTLAQRWLDMLWRARGKAPDLRPTWPETIYRGSIEALEMALRYDVDWVFVVSGMYCHPDALELMRRAGLRIAVLFTESPYEDVKQARVAALVDMCWTNERTSVERLRMANRNVRYLRHAYDPLQHTTIAELERLESGVPRHDVVFVGSGFQERIDLLAAVDWDGIDFGLYGTWDLLPPRHRLRRYLRDGVVDNAKTAALYRCAHIGLNLYRSSATYGRKAPRIEGAESLNPRAYELAACGAFQVSEYRAEVRQTFGTAVPTFGGPRELEWTVRRYLDRPVARVQAAERARRRVAPHTFAARAAQVLTDLERLERRSYSASGGAPAIAGQKGA